MSENKFISVENPITGKELYKINEATDSQVQDARNKARAIEKKIASMSLDERISEVLKINDWVLKNVDFILDSVIMETGKSRFDGFTSEVFEVCDVIDIYKKKAKGILKDKKVHTPIFLMGKTSKIIVEPMGTILIISPWNYPFYQGIVPTILAFLAGNAVIYKPSEITPLKPLWDKLIAESGFLKDAFQVVYGGREVGAQLIESKPDKIHFTGSVRAGKEIMALCAKQLIPVDLELGGKDAAIVFDDVNLERTVNGVMWGAFTTAGQSCTSLERLYVHENIYDNFLKMLVDRTQKLRPSHPNRDIKKADDCDVGCISSPQQVRIIEDHIEDAIRSGATVMCGGIKEKGSPHIPPTVVAGVTHQMKLGMEETFGPVVAVMKFKTEQEAIDLANDSPYGLGGSVWSKDLVRGERVAKAIKTGNVSINNHMITEANPSLPFGGIKDSGFGRYKGDYGLTTFSNIKSILIDKQSDMIDPHWYPFTNEKFTLLNNMMQSYFIKSKKWITFAKNALTVDNIGKKQKLK